MNRHHWWEAVERRRLDMHEEARDATPFRAMPEGGEAKPLAKPHVCAACGAPIPRRTGAGRPAVTCGDEDCQRDYANAVRRERYANGPGRALDGRSGVGVGVEGSDGR